jgi:2-oxoglutarate ferredoxin oxidoreductase subunit alpha
MVDKRLRKLQGLVSELTPPEFEGGKDCDLLLVSWGSVKGSVKEAAAELNDQGRKVASCHFSQVWPLLPASFLPRFAKARQVVMVEGNATGQFAGLIRRETGFEIKQKILRYDGLPITPEYIQLKLAE